MSSQIDPLVFQRIKEAIVDDVKLWNTDYAKQSLIEQVGSLATIPHDTKSRRDLLAAGVDLLRASIKDHFHYLHMGDPNLANAVSQAYQNAFSSALFGQIPLDQINDYPWLSDVTIDEIVPIALALAKPEDSRSWMYLHISMRMPIALGEIAREIMNKCPTWKDRPVALNMDDFRSLASPDHPLYSRLNKPC